MLQAKLVRAVERDVCVLEGNVLGRLNRPLPVVGNTVVAQHGTQYAARGRGVAVGVLPAACGDVHGAPKVAIAIEQAHHHVSAVDGSVYAGLALEVIGARLVPAVGVLYLLPRRTPVLVGSAGGNGGCHTFVEVRLGRDGLEGLGNDVVDIVRDKG